MATLYRVKLNSEHFNMVRRYMVDKNMKERCDGRRGDDRDRRGSQSGISD